MTLSEKLYRLRRSKGYSQEELAEKLGVSRQAVSKWERGESSPDISNLIKAAALYDISVDELAGCLRGDPSIPAESTPSRGISLDKRDYASTRSCAESVGIIRSSSFVKMNVPDDSGEIYPVQEKYPVQEVYPQNNSAPGFIPLGNDGTETAKSEAFPKRSADTSVPPPKSSPFNSAANYDMSYTAPQSVQMPAKSSKKQSLQSILSPSQYALYKKLMRFPYWGLVLLGFFFFGGVFDIWEYTWILFLTIPLYYTAIPALFRKNPYIFCYPVAAVIMHLSPLFVFNFAAFGNFGEAWAVICYLSIPLYYTAILAYQKRDMKFFCFPVLITMVFIVAGLIFYNFEAFLWLFALIPFYYYFSKSITQAVFKRVK